MRAVTRVAIPEPDAEWLNIALCSAASHCEKIARQCRRADEAENLVTENARTEGRWLRMHHDEMGMLVIEGRLPPEVGAVVEKAIETAMADLREEERQRAGGEESQSNAASAPGQRTSEPRVTSCQRRADALVRIAERSFRGKSQGPARTADRFQVVVHVDAAVLADPNTDGRCELEHGPSLSAQSARRMTCDCSMVAMLHDANGDVLNVGRKTRVISAALRRAMNERDQGCCFPGCNCRFVEGHHIEHWIVGGETKLGNILSVCKFHHTLLHERGFQVRLDEAGAPVFTGPTGTEVRTSITPTPRRGEAVEVITRWNREAGVLIDAETNLSEWDGETPQYGYIAEVMTELADSRRVSSP